MYIVLRWMTEKTKMVSSFTVEEKVLSLVSVNNSYKQTNVCTEIVRAKYDSIEDVELFLQL